MYSQKPLQVDEEPMPYDIINLTEPLLDFINNFNNGTAYEDGAEELFDPFESDGAFLEDFLEFYKSSNPTHKIVISRVWEEDYLGFESHFILNAIEFKDPEVYAQECQDYADSMASFSERRTQHQKDTDLLSALGAFLSENPGAIDREELESFLLELKSKE